MTYYIGLRFTDGSDYGGHCVCNDDNHANATMDAIIDKHKQDEKEVASQYLSMLENGRYIRCR